MKLLTILFGFVCYTFAYYTPGKDHFMADGLFRELVNKIGNDFVEPSYIEFSGGRLPLDARSLTKELEEDLFPLEYDEFENNLHPSIRDQEFLEHSTLWGGQLMSGGAGEEQQKLRPLENFNNKPEMKADTTLPAYCNPPNPCPVGYTAESNCLEDFENTALFSRKYQEIQDCMCDSEHMFYCPPLTVDGDSEELAEEFDEMNFNKFIERSLQMDPMYSRKSLVAKKYHNDKRMQNPFLAGEKLPVAAKKGNKVLY